MKSTFEHITLFKNAPDRVKTIKIIKRLNLIHNIIALIVFGILWWSIVQEERPFNLISYVIVLCASLFGSYAIIAPFIMCIPSCIFDRPVSPEIILLDKYLVYLGGSIGLRYASTVWGLTSFSYLHGIEDSQIIMRDDILPIEIEKERFTFPFLVRRKRYISIRYKNGKVITGGWLDDDEMQDIVKKINQWRA